MAFIKTKNQNKIFNFILDKSPDVLRRPALNIWISFFYNSERNQKMVALVDVSIMKSCNITSLALVLEILAILRKTGEMF